MPKKIYDILPPKVAHKVEDAIKDLSISHKKKKGHLKVTKHQDKKKHFPLKEILVGGAIIIILLAVYFASKLPKADIQIWPKTDTLVLEEKIIIDKSVQSVDFYNKAIPAQFVEQIEDSRQEFQATGIASNDGKASGIIKIYNKISPSETLALKKGTHFLSDSGKYFVTLEKITIPAGNKNSPGSIDAKVQAKEAGEDYNIKASTFSVPKLYGTSYYYSIWGESKSDMTGGYTGKVKKVTKEDIETAKDVLTKKLLSQAEDSMKNKLSASDVLLDGAILREVIDANSDVGPDSIADKFNESARVKVSALVFKKQDIEEFVKADILSNLSEENILLENSLNLNYGPDIIDIKNRKESINLAISAKTYSKINKDDLVDLLSRKSSDQIKEIIDSKYGDNISQIKTNFWPFWVQKAPKDKSRIKINLIFE
mgnify:CR=1 FL=1